MNDPTNSVGRFFDALTDDYTATIERCFPRYREMLWALLDYLPESQPVQAILELGAGTGNLTVLLAEKFPDATITAVDLAGESLAICRERLGNHGRFVFERKDFRDLAFDDGAFDLVAASISVHHLTSSEKQQLFRCIHSWLKPIGVFAYVDQHAGATSDLYQRHIENWHRLSSAAGSTEQEWQMWMQHQCEHDHHDSLADQMRWLGEAGFDIVDCPWRYLLWTVLQARKCSRE